MNDYTVEPLLMDTPQLRTPTNLRYNGHFQVSRMFLQYISHPWVADTPLLHTTDTNLVPVCTHAIELPPEATPELRTPLYKGQTIRSQWCPL